MDVIHVVELIAFTASLVAGVALLLYGTMVWFLNHPSE